MQDEALSNVDEFEDWLSTGVVKTHMEPIPFWEGMLAAGNPLARMALDYLSIPGKVTFYSSYFVADDIYSLYSHFN